MEAGESEVQDQPWLHSKLKLIWTVWDPASKQTKNYIKNYLKFELLTSTDFHSVFSHHDWQVSETMGTENLGQDAGETLG